MKRAANRRLGGFAVLDLAVAATIVTAAVVLCIHTGRSTLRIRRNADERELALGALGTTVDAILATGHAELSITYPSNEPVQGLGRLPLAEEEVLVSYPTYPDGSPLPLPLEIEASVSWRAWNGRARVERLVTLKCR